MDGYHVARVPLARGERFPAVARGGTYEVGHVEHDVRVPAEEPRALCFCLRLYLCPRTLPSRGDGHCYSAAPSACVNKALIHTTRRHAYTLTNLPAQPPHS
jgi:hypothetical protein